MKTFALRKRRTSQIEKLSIRVKNPFDGTIQFGASKTNISSCLPHTTKGGFVMFSVQSNMKTPQEQDVTKEESLAGFRKAALLAVSPR
jgi:hypothetical protein